MKKLFLLASLAALNVTSAQAQLKFCIVDGQVRSGAACEAGPAPDPEPTPDPEPQPGDDVMLDPTMDDGGMGLGSLAAWTDLPGRLSQIDVGADGTIFGLGTLSRSGIFDIFTYNGASWRKVPGRVHEIEVAPDGLPIGAGSGQRMWQYDGSRWTLASSDVIDVAVDDRGTRFTALSNGQVAMQRGEDWVQIGTGVSVEAGPGGLVVMQDTDGPLRVVSPFGHFTLPGEVSDYSVGADGRIYGVLVDGAHGANEAVTWDVPYGWKSLGLTDVAGVTAGPDGTVYAWMPNGAVQMRKMTP